MPRVLVDHRFQLPGILRGTLTRLAHDTVRTIYREEHMPQSAELSLSFVDDTEMRVLNRDYRDLDRTTDVLAFAMSEGRPLNLPDEDTGIPLPLGDIVISLETADRQAIRLEHSVRREVATLLIHGVLHILGHEHTDASAEGKKQRREMRRLENHYLDKLEAEGIL